MNTDWLHGELKRTLTLLAMPAEEQLAYLAELGGSLDELGLEFDDIGGSAAGLQRAGRLAPAQVAAIGAIRDQLKSMSGTANAMLWRKEAIQTDERWHRVRELAKEALRLLSE
jgi:hypothetical protein